MSSRSWPSGYELRDDGPAAGRWRGGIGAVKTWRFLERTGAGSTGDHRKIDPPRGLFGGADGKPGRVALNSPGSDARELPAKLSDAHFDPGDVLEIVLVSGAGYGSPFERDPEKVLADVLDEHVTIDEAEKDYGVVVITHASTLSVDVEATIALRAK